MAASVWKQNPGTTQQVPALFKVSPLSALLVKGVYSKNNLGQITHNCGLTLFWKLSFPHKVSFSIQASFGHLFLIPGIWFQNPYTLAICVKGEIWSLWTQVAFYPLPCLNGFRPGWLSRFPRTSHCSILETFEIPKQLHIGSLLHWKLACLRNSQKIPIVCLAPGDLCTIDWSNQDTMVEEYCFYDWLSEPPTPVKVKLLSLSGL